MIFIKRSIIATNKLRFVQKNSPHLTRCMISSNDKKQNKTVEDRDRINSVTTIQKISNGIKEGVEYVAISTVDMVKNPKETWKMIKDTAHHYWYGTKLLWTEIKMAYQIVKRLLQGSDMTRRERLQLIRTTMDLFRLVPFAIFVIVPFMEFLLPFALRIFPNMLPSTFQVNEYCLDNCDYDRSNFMDKLIF